MYGVRVSYTGIMGKFAGENLRGGNGRSRKQHVSGSMERNTWLADVG